MARAMSQFSTEQRSVTILGATGSVGQSTLDVINGHPGKYRVEALTAHRNVQLLAQQARQMQAAHAVIGDEALYGDLKSALSGTGISVAAGVAAVEEAAARPADWTMAAIVGMAGLKPTLQAVRRGGAVALANKEALVAAGPVMMQAVEQAGATLLPVDSEHNAVFQVFDPKQRAGIVRIILTASGGPFLRKSRAEIENVTPAEAVRHPTWSMGAKISIDSATMMNKSLEIIEAAYLFNLKSQDIEVVIHPQSIVHSMVEYSDGSILAQMGSPDMRTPIAYTLGWPERVQTTGQRLDLNKNMNFSFEPIDLERFYAVSLARKALEGGKGLPTVFNAANEVAVAAFMEGRLGFSKIEKVAEQALQSASGGVISSLEDVIALDAETRVLAGESLRGLQS